MTHRAVAPVLLFAFLATGCQTTRMAVDPVLAESVEAWAVKGHNPRVWNRPVVFGPFSTERVREGATRSWLLEGFGVGAGTARQPYRFTQAGPDHRLEVECFAQATQGWWGGLVVDLARGRKPILVCGIGEDLQANRWVLVLTRDASGFSGELQRSPEGSGPGYVVTSVHELKGSRLPQFDPVGYQISEAGGRVSVAVETVNAGRVWMTAQSVPGRQEILAAASTALLLFRPPEVK